MALSTQQGFVLLLAYGHVLQGWALAMQDQGEDGMAQIHQGMKAYLATGADGVTAAIISLLLAEAMGR